VLVPCAVGVALIAAARPAAADGACSEVVYSFQPDCYHPNGGAACGQTLDHLDFGPQIAVWIETPDHTLVDTLMVTSLTATRGIGNRPGIWNFRSGPKFPYGKRWMSLPLWAYARGKLFDAAFMQDDRETWMGFHEAHSSPESYFCRPFLVKDLDLSVDAVTCPSQGFNSAKGKLEAATKVYYPPRNDLLTFTNSDCDAVGGLLATCHVSASTYGTLNDLDAVAAATPPYGHPFSRTWHIPAALPAGSYAIVVEVNKEFDTNASHSHPAFEDPNLPAYGIDGNFGQPSVLYRVPVRLGGSSPTAATTSAIVGYSNWTGDAPLDGTLLPKDGTISTSVAGSGEMRLLTFAGAGGTGRVHVALQRCPVVMCTDDAGCPDASSPDDGSEDPDAASPDVSSPDGGVAERPPIVVTDPCSPPPAPPVPVAALTVDGTSATSASFSFANTSADGQMVAGYQVHYRGGTGTFMTADEFQSAPPGPDVTPGGPAEPAQFTVDNLKPNLDYIVGIRAVDHCQQFSQITVRSFHTPAQKFTQLSGCFVATAAYGSALEPHVAALRHARDRLRPASPLFAAATDLYYRAGPAAAAVVGRSDVARALARRVIEPFASLAEALDAIAPLGSTAP